MKKSLGSIYYLMLSYRFETILFWIINSSILLSFAVLSILLEDNIKLYITISAPVYIFVTIQSVSILKKTLSFLLRMGINRMQYASSVTVFVLLYSVLHSTITTLYHAFFDTLENVGVIKEVFTMHPMSFFLPNLSYLQIFLFDFALLIFIIFTGLILNVVFHRLGKIGGFSILGFLAFMLLLSSALGWFEELYLVFGDNSFFINVLYSLLASVVLAAIYFLSLRKISILSNAR